MLGSVERSPYDENLAGVRIMTVSEALLVIAIAAGLVAGLRSSLCFVVKT